MPDLRELPLSALDILTGLMAQAYVDLRLDGEVGDVRATLDVKFDLFGPWTHVANVYDAMDAADALLQLTAHAEAWAMAEGRGRAVNQNGEEL